MVWLVRQISEDELRARLTEIDAQMEQLKTARNALRLALEARTLAARQVGGVHVSDAAALSPRVSDQPEAASLNARRPEGLTDAVRRALSEADQQTLPASRLHAILEQRCWYPDVKDTRKALGATLSRMR